VSSRLGVSDEKIDALPDYAKSELYSEPERVALEFADTITITDRDVSDERGFFDDDGLVELTATIAWENASSKFNRALRVPSQGLRKRL